MVEGRGATAPHPVAVRLSPTDRAFVRDAVARRMRDRGYAHRRDPWGRGLIGELAVVYGLAGEVAFSDWLYRTCRVLRPADVTYREFGDRGRDFEAFGLTIQVKCGGSHTSKVRIRRITESRRLCELTWDVLVQARVARPLAADGLPTAVEFLGWGWRQELTTGRRLERSRLAGHFNIVADASELQPMSRLADLVLSRKAEAERWT